MDKRDSDRGRAGREESSQVQIDQAKKGKHACGSREAREDAGGGEEKGRQIGKEEAEGRKGLEGGE
eukprot:3698792-Pleurochrysis_carterae.AAC.7